MNMRKFYGIACIFMSIALLGSVWNLAVTWVNITNGARLASLFGGVAFNLLLAILFFGFWKSTPPSTDFSKTMSEEELNSLFNKYNKEELTQNTYSMQNKNNQRGKNEKGVA